MHGRLITAMVSPFDPDGELDLEGARTLTEHLLSEGSDGVVVAGSTGESPTLTSQEKLELLKTVGEVCKGRAEVIMGVGTYSTATTIENAKLAHETGADALLVVTPYYNRPPQSGLLAHFRAVADATPLPNILYDIPSRTGRKIEHETIIQLLDHQNIVGVKDAAGDLAGTARLMADKPSDAIIWSGDDALTLPMLGLGVHGVISVASHIVGPRMRAMLDAHAKGDVEEAARIGARLMRVFDVLFITSNPIALKAALRLKGLPGGDPRLPLPPATDEEIDRVSTVLREAGVL
ncbi:MAG: 4-hydroxy-tetrahydrodipicolinate synthase [Actinomycetota bacterium]